MNFWQRLKEWDRKRRARKRSGVETAATLRRIELLLTSRGIEDWRDLHLADNPLLAYGRKDYSQNDEDGIIDEIVRRTIGAGSNTFLELGVGDGCENNTLNLLAQGWRGAWLGGEPLRLRTLGPRLTFRQCWLELDTIVPVAREVLDSQRIGQPDLLSLDLDGNDYHLCRALIESGMAPAIWVIEYNPCFGPGTHWVMPYDSAHRWSVDDYYGASLRAFNDLLDPAGYRLIACNITGLNAFYVRKDFSEVFPEVPADWRRLFMQARYVPYPWLGHPKSLRTIEHALLS